MRGVRALLFALPLAFVSGAASAASSGREARGAPQSFQMPGQEAWDKLRRMREELTRLVAELEPLVERADALAKEHAAGRLGLDDWSTERVRLLAELRPRRSRLTALLAVLDAERQNLEGLGVVNSFGRVAGAKNAAAAAPDTHSSSELLTSSIAAQEMIRRAELAEDDRLFDAARNARDARRAARGTAAKSLLGLAVLLAAGWLLFRRRNAGPEPGTVLNGNYRLERRLDWGQAGFTRSAARFGDAAFEALDIALDRKVVLESLRPEAEEDAGALLAGARAAAALKHPNLLEVYSFFQQGERICLVYEHFEGRPLSAVLAGGRRLSPAEAGPLLAQVSSAVDYAHAHGVARLDLSAERVLLASDGRVKLAGYALPHFKGSDRDALAKLRALLAS
ncbi:MAG TPA: hypothetical protein DCM05_13790 [Elusimicrobia bacterium]|nr:hypothetical protein [Elusimicrobiota bacterium]